MWRSSGSEGWGEQRTSAHVRFWIAAVVVTGAWLFGASTSVLIVIGLIGIGYALLQALNDWATALHVLSLYHSDQALFLHGHHLYIRPLGESRRMGWK